MDTEKLEQMRESLFKLLDMKLNYYNGKSVTIDIQGNLVEVNCVYEKLDYELYENKYIITSGDENSCGTVIRIDKWKIADVLIDELTDDTTVLLLDGSEINFEIV